MHRVSKDMEAKNTAGLNKRVGLWRCQIRGLTTVVIMCYIQDPVIYLFVVLANVFYVLVQTVWISLRGILWASTAHQTSLYNKPHHTTKTAEYQYLNEAGIPQDWCQHMNVL